MKKRGRLDRRINPALLAAVAAATVLAAGCEGNKTAADAPPGMTYESIARLPDFSGWWYIDLDPKTGFNGLAKLMAGSVQPLLKPEMQGPYKGFLEGLAAIEKNPGAFPDPVDRGFKPNFCVPPIFGGFNGFGGVEFLFTPGRVTITNEEGMLRRVYLGRELPADVDESKMGTSVGHWEGKTLVVETSGLDPGGQFAGTVLLLKTGRGAHMIERFTLRDAGTMEIARQLVAPDVLTAPYETTFVYRRDSGHVFHEASSCETNDRSVNHETGRQQFDLTPPEDLPPPPSQ